MIDLTRLWSWVRAGTRNRVGGTRKRRRGVPLALEVLEGRSLPSANTFRIATYNIEADINGVTTPRPGLYEVLEGIGEERLSGNVQPIDILALRLVRLAGRRRPRRTPGFWAGWRLSRDGEL